MGDPLLAGAGQVKTKDAGELDPIVFTGTPGESGIVPGIATNTWESGPSPIVFIAAIATSYTTPAFRPMSMQFNGADISSRPQVLSIIISVPGPLFL